jgi:predicted AlkP superfamily pyrophosphatase or phosphodiesterase
VGRDDCHAALMKWRLVWLSVSLATLLVARAAQPQTPPLIILSLDGFRWDYCQLFPEAAPTLRILAAAGVTTRGLIPVFPSNTFPNHYSIVTGLYPAHHGIINNDFFDPELSQVFRYNQPMARDARWWRGEPIWVTAIKQGRKAASSFWVGSESEIAGVRPTFWRVFDSTLPFDQRLDELSGWLKLPLAERPAVITFYLEETNSAGHRFGPGSPEVVAAITSVDQCVGALLTRLRSEGVEPNLIIASDHGMTATGAARTVIIDDVIDLKTVQIDADGSALAIRPLDGDAAALVKKFSATPHVKAYLAEDLPSRLHLDPSPRVAPVWVLPEEGWHIVARSTFERLKRRFPEKGYVAGDHGYDPALTTMRGIFIAHGPSFQSGVQLPEVENIHLYNLMCAVLKLRPAHNDGDDRLVKAALR